MLQLPMEPSRSRGLLQVQRRHPQLRTYGSQCSAGEGTPLSPEAPSRPTDRTTQAHARQRRMAGQRLPTDHSTRTCQNIYNRQQHQRSSS